MSLEDILSFFSGASNVPPLGFDISPSLLFDHEAVYPTASTCALQLTLPTRYSDDYNQFKSKMTQAFTCHGGFGLIQIRPVNIPATSANLLGSCISGMSL